MAAIELVQPGTDRPDLAVTAAVMEQTRQRGLLVGNRSLVTQCTARSNSGMRRS